MARPKHLASLSLLLVALALNAGCSSRFIQSFTDTMSLRQALIKEYGHREINVFVRNDNLLGITFINSPIGELAEAERLEKAQEIARFARAHYRSIDRIARIWVAFVQQQRAVLFFNRYVYQGSYMFDKEHIEGGDLYHTPPTWAEVNEPTVSYSEPRNETTVMVNYLLLANGMQNRLLLVPSFVVPGKQLRPPDHIDLDFASYAQMPLFAKDHRITFVVDGQQLASGLPELTTGRDKNTVIEYLSYKLPYSQFQQLVRGQRVQIMLGSREIDLTTAQLNTLRAMKTCGDAGACP